MHCSYTYYCSPQCRENNQVQHGRTYPHECGTPFVALLPERAVLATRLSLLSVCNQHILGPCLFQTICQHSNVSITLEENVEYDCDGNDRVLQLLQHHIQLVEFEELLEMVIEALLCAVTVVKNTQNIENIGGNYQQLQRSYLEAAQQIKINLQQPEEQQQLQGSCPEAGQNIQTNLLQPETFQHQGSTKQNQKQTTRDQNQQSDNSETNYKQLVRQLHLLILLNIGIIKINGIAYTPQMSSSDQDRIALGVFPVASFFNHSCKPNIQLRFVNDQVIARTIRQVERGQQLNISYGPQIGAQNTNTRKELLQKQYYFTCRCQGCCDKQQQLLENQAEGYECANKACQNGVTLAENVSSQICQQCGNEIPLQQTKQIFQRHSEGSSLSDQGDRIMNLENEDSKRIQMVHNLYAKSWSILSSNCLHPYNQELGKLAAKLRDVCRTQGNYDAAQRWGQKVVDIVEKHYGVQSIQAAYEKMELCLLQEEMQLDKSEANVLRMQINKLLWLYYGDYTKW
eukprot:TRINITY_DN14176_c1_g1_i10.p2 TRINITY_DN14176_c1_g1~~TRINITY_DN14176_c1_g1_i10.p2  ORF type:complete len:513 (-),score=47.05 TRINITY_DN14176_c1_g1_i10:458-1996(-)